MGPIDITMVAVELEAYAKKEDHPLWEQARILRLIAGDVEGNMLMWKEKYRWAREANGDLQTKANTE
jgi:hypothetical protein